MLGRTALLLAHTTLARGLVARAAAPALSTRSSSVCMQAQASRLTVLVPVADDSEEIETSCITDTLTRAGAEVVVASVMPELQVRMSRGLKVAASVDTWSHRVPPWAPQPRRCVRESRSAAVPSVRPAAYRTHPRRRAACPMRALLCVHVPASGAPHVHACGVVTLIEIEIVPRWVEIVPRWVEIVPAQVVADCLIEECRGKPWDAIALPGGMPGAERLRDSAPLKALIGSRVAVGRESGGIAQALIRFRVAVALRLPSTLSP